MAELPRKYVDLAEVPEGIYQGLELTLGKIRGALALVEKEEDLSPKLNEIQIGGMGGFEYCRDLYRKIVLVTLEKQTPEKGKEILYLDDVKLLIQNGDFVEDELDCFRKVKSVLESTDLIHTEES